MANKKKIIKSMTLDEAKEEVLKLVQQGVNYRDIVKEKFLIGDKIKKFNPTEISKINKESNGVKDISKNIDEDTALLFKKFSEGKNPKDLVIETKLNPDFVKEAYTKFMGLEDMRIIPVEVYDNVYGLISRMKVFDGSDPVVDLIEDQGYLGDAVRYFIDPENF